jgi:phage-related tail protein|tara:strand:+ start:246 stop:452 length:207 start_codon:yes stop_codon:yes gene_type:complete
MATRKKLYETIFGKLEKFFKKKKSWENLPPEVKAAAEKDPKIKKQLKKIEKDSEELEKALDKAIKMDF